MTVIFNAPIENIQEIHKEMIGFIQEALNARRYQLLPFLCDFHLRDIPEIPEKSFFLTAAKLAGAYKIAASDLRENHPEPGEGDRILRELQAQFEIDRRAALREKMIIDLRTLKEQLNVCQASLLRLEEVVNRIMRNTSSETWTLAKNTYKNERAVRRSLLHTQELYLAFSRNIMLIKL